MFVSFLIPHVDRGAGPLFHLIMLLQMSRFAPDEICFIGDDAYFAEEHVPFDEELVLGTIRFSCVSRERYRAYGKAVLPFSAVAPLYADGRSHLDAFATLLTAEQAPLVAAISAALDELDVGADSIEAFLSWSNCPSLSALAVRLGKPVIHNELGPLRGPAYQDTVYFDFRGVNGNTTPATAWTDRAALAAELDGVNCLPDEDLRKLLYCGGMPEAPVDAGAAPQRYPLGVALQVEDDSNTLVFGCGYDAIRLLYKAQRDYAPDQVLVRSHPGARLGYRGGLGDCDTSPTSVAFLQRIAHLVTINSSVAAEAALWGVPFTTLGDTPFSMLSSPLGAVRAAASAGAATAIADAPLAPVDAEPATAVAIEEDKTAEAVPAGPDEEAKAIDVASLEAAPAASPPDLMLNALLLAYLVPGSLLFDPDYYRWRLAGATLRECFTRHLQVLKRNSVHEGTALPVLAPAPVAAVPRAADTPHRNPALWSATRSLSRSAGNLQKQLSELELQLATAVAERDKIWDERCWFQTNLERVERELGVLRNERDTLRLALAKQQGEADILKHDVEWTRGQAANAQGSLALALQAQLAAVKAFTVEADAVNARYAETEAALAEMRGRFDALSGDLVDARARHATTEAQSNALLEELNRTQRERIEAIERAVAVPSR